MKPLSILVVDDDDRIHQLLREWLEQAGHAVSTATSGHIALTLLKQRPFDVVLTDVVMPDGDGLELIMDVKKTDVPVRIVAMSGGGAFLKSIDCLNMALGIGANAILRKPFTASQVLSAINLAVPSQVQAVS